MEGLLPYITNNIPYYLILLVTLFLWDIMDLYIELRNFKFVTNLTFAAYYWIRAIFCVALMELGYSIGLFTTPSKSIMSFLIPLSFSSVLQNLVVKVGGVERSINLGEVFDKFKFRINETLISKDVIEKVLSQRRLLLTKKVSNDMILKTCRFYSVDEKEFQSLLDKTKDLDEDSKRVEYIIWLVDRAKTVDIASELIQEGGVDNT